MSTEQRLSRRAAMQTGVALGLTAALGAKLGWAADVLPPILRTVPSTGEKLPVIGIGTNAYDVTAPADLASCKDVLKNLPLLGGKIVDTARAYGRSEEVIGQLVSELGNRDRLFLATKTPLGGDISNPRAVIDEAFRRLRTDRIDLYEIHNFYGMNELLPVLREYKQAGKIRYIGATTSVESQHAQLVDAINKQSLDFIQVNYSIDDRSSARLVLPAAQEKGVAVLINVPLGGRRGSFMPKLANKPLPAWAAEVDAASWAQLLLKYNLSHPAVTAVIPGTTIMPYLEDNQRAGRGRLPDAAMRKRIEDLWTTI